MKLAKTNTWSFEETEKFLESAVIPIRIAVTENDYPMICSLWFRYVEGELLCAIHESSHLAKVIKRVGKCAFEIAVNEPPYKGVRGTAKVRLEKDNAEPVLESLITRYLGGLDSTLSKWLLSRAEGEYVMRLIPDKVSTWDYSRRMGS